MLRLGAFYTCLTDISSGVMDTQQGAFVSGSGTGFVSDKVGDRESKLQCISSTLVHFIYIR